MPAGLSVYAKEILRLPRESSLARIPTPAAVAPAALELGSYAFPGPSSRCLRALLPFSSLGALAEVLLPRSVTLGVLPGELLGR